MDGFPVPGSPPAVTLDDLAVERSPQTDKLNAWRLQLEGRQRELERLGRQLDEREKALAVTRAGWREGTIMHITMRYSENSTDCEMILLIGKDELRIECEYSELREFCGGDDVSCLISKKVYYADKTIAPENPRGLLSIDIAERAK